MPEADDADNIIPRPSRTELVEASETAAMRELRVGHLIALRIEAGQRVSTAYAAVTFKDELQSRLRGDHAPTQNEEQNRLRSTTKR